jgi:transposase
MFLLIVSTVYNWIKLYKENGKKALELQKRGRKVESDWLMNPAQEENIQFMNTKYLPKNFGLEFFCTEPKSNCGISETRIWYRDSCSHDG